MQKAMLGHEVIDLSKLTKPEMVRLNRRQAFFCITCKKPVIFKNGARKRAHFAHQKEGLSISRPESAAHLLVKHAMAKWLKSQGIDAKIEQRFTTIDRIADIYFEYQKAQYVLEIQKSPMSDLEFKQRTLDYQSVDATVWWIFLGDVTQKAHTFRLPPVMLGRGAQRLFHFCTQTAQLRFFEAPVFVTTRDIYAKSICQRLSSFQIDDLLKKDDCEKGMHFDRMWLAIKKQFRIRGWFYLAKSEKKLLEQCLIRGFNLSLLPTEIGWPVTGDAMRKPLFVWQSYVLLTIMKQFNIGDVFTLDQLIRLLKIEYQVVIRSGVSHQVRAYLKWLVMFNIITAQQASFKYVKLPTIRLRMEEQLSRDKRFVDTVEKLWKV